MESDVVTCSSFYIFFVYNLAKNWVWGTEPKLLAPQFVGLPLHGLSISIYLKWWVQIGPNKYRPDRIPALHLADLYTKTNGFSNF